MRWTGSLSYSGMTCLPKSMRGPLAQPASVAVTISGTARNNASLLRDAARNSARAALLVEAATRSPELLVPATHDWLHQEARRPSYAASMDLVDRLRADGHAATISGAGPSVLVLTTTDRVDSVRSGADEIWTRLVPGIPAEGVTVRLR